MTQRKEQLKELLDQLESLTSRMEVPTYKRRSVAWLSKNLAHKNKEHPHFENAMKIVSELLANGVAHG